MTDPNAETLAIHGGRAVIQQALQAPSWPPVTTAGEERLLEVYRSRKWSFHSPAERDFAASFADHHGAEHGVFMANGTVTLESALAACGITTGDEVIVPALTWPATAMAVHYRGATPVFVDVEPDTLCLCPQAFEQAITQRTRAVIPVHLYGSMADLDAILAIARRHDLRVIEDCAHMQGGRWNGRGVGSWGDVGSFSFQQSKTMASGEGGICISNDAELAARMFSFKHIGFAPDAQQGAPTATPPSDLVCHNYRGLGFCAAILHDQLEGLDALLARYQRGVSIISDELRGVDGVRIQSPGRRATTQGYYNLAFIFDRESVATVPREVIAEALRAEGFGMGAPYGPVYRHKLYNMPQDSYRIAGGACPVAEGVGTERTFTIPHPWLAADEQTLRTIGRVVAKVAKGAEQLLAQPTMATNER